MKTDISITPITVIPMRLLKIRNSIAEQQKDILDRQMEIFKAVDKKDTEIREHEMEMARLADKKDTEKKEFFF